MVFALSTMLFSILMYISYHTVMLFILKFAFFSLTIIFKLIYFWLMGRKSTWDHSNKMFMLWTNIICYNMFAYFAEIYFIHSFISYCQAQFKFSTSSVQFELRLALRLIITTHPPLPTRESRDAAWKCISKCGTPSWKCSVICNGSW